MNTRLPGNRQAPAAARSYVADQLSASDVPWGGLLDDVLLIASELVTNAVTAGATHVDLSLRITARRLDLLIADDAHGKPEVRTVDEEAVSGRGLRIVEQLTDAWSVTLKGRGKQVTATWLDRRSSVRSGKS
jgi:anti-sigma regulatory factor (Ser/Thr protein kinase)